MANRSLAALCALGACLGGCRGADGLPDAALLHSVVGTCSAAEGKVQVRRVGLFYWEDVAVGSTFRAGDWVRTEPLSTARIELLTGSGLDVGENTTVIVDATLLATGTEHPLVTVETGATEFSVGAAQGPIGVKSPDGTVAQIGASQGDEVLVFRVEREGDRAELAVTRGNARITIPGKESRKVKARETVRMSRHLADEKALELVSAPVLLGPDPGARVAAEAQPVLLSWAAPTGAVTYRLHVARDAGFRKLVAAKLLDETAAKLGLGPGVYFWRVAGRDAQGRSGTFAQARTLVVEEALPDFLVGPEDGAVLQMNARRASLTFSWQAIPDAATYRVALSRHQDLSDPVRVTRSAAPRLELQDLPLGTYFWNVFAEPRREVGGGQPLSGRPHKLTLEFSRKAIAPNLTAPSTIDWK